MMRALLIGYGKMGRLLARFAPHYNIAISSIVDRKTDFASEPLPSSCMGYKSLVQEAIDNSDIAFDFSSPDGIVGRVLQLAMAKKPFVIGTTGWSSSEEEVGHIIEQYGSSLLASENFSLGATLFLHIVDTASQLFSQFPQYDAGVFELCQPDKHKQESKLTSEITKRIQSSRESRLSMLQMGHFPGTHNVYFDSPEDTITLQYAARNRDGAAKGALAAAYWLIDKKGMFSTEDLISEKIGAKYYRKTKSST